MFTVPVLIGIAVAGLIAILIGIILGSRKPSPEQTAERQDETVSSTDSASKSSTSPAAPPLKAVTGGLEIRDLEERTGLSADELRSLKPEYRVVEIAKHGGGKRRLEIPDERTKEIQATVLRRLFSAIRSHSAACGFERATSIVNAATPHVGRRVVIKLDIRRFFQSTTDDRVLAWFQSVGWSQEAAQLLTHLTTWDGHLPQGAPTSPRLSNLINAPLDEALLRLAEKHKGAYTRYADDITFSFNFRSGRRARGIIQAARRILRSFGYAMHGGRKLKVLRKNQRQSVLGLVVNDRIALPRHKRRWLRAVRHRRDQTGQCSLSDQQLQGWESLQQMIENQRD